MKAWTRNKQGLSAPRHIMGTDKNLKSATIEDMYRDEQGGVTIQFVSGDLLSYIHLTKAEAEVIKNAL